MKQNKISKKEPENSNMILRKKWKKERDKSNRLFINLESCKMLLPHYLKVGKKSNKFQKISMKLLHKKFMKWQLLLLSKRLVKPKKISNRVQETSNKEPKMLEKILKRNIKKVNMKLKKPQECSLKSPSIKMSKRQLPKDGKT